jgi:hypothetical protein
MARHAKTLPLGQDNTRHLSVGIIALTFPSKVFQRIIDDCGRTSQRVRDLPATVVAYYVIAMSLFPSVGYQSVLEWLLGGLRWLDAGHFRISGKGSLSRARARLGEEPMQRIFQELARPLKCRDLPGSYWRHLHLVAIDGTSFALQDTASNEEAFGRSSNQHGAGTYPICRAVLLCEVGTHMIFAAAQGAYRDGEMTLAKGVLNALEPGMLCLADRLFPGYELWKQAVASGAHLLWRAKESLPLERIKTLEDGSWIARWLPKEKKKTEPHGLVVRVIEYRLAESRGGSEPSGVYRLLTTLLDCVEAPACELAGIYPERWEIELTIKEAKEVLRDKEITLRSKIAELVRQEFWGLLLAHYLVRRMIAMAAQGCGRSPDTLSFTRSVEIIKSTQAGPVLSFPP